MLSRLPKALIAVCTFIVCQNGNAAVADWASREMSVFDLVNVQRSHHQLTALIGDDRLRASALGHSQAMANDDFFSHTDRNTGSIVGARATDAGYIWNLVGENIAAGQGRLFQIVASQVEISEDDPLNAARDVMYGTTDLAQLSDFDRTRNGDGYNSWDEVGMDWNDADWDGWQTSQLGSGGWMGSSGHRNNILTAGFSDIGVGYVFQPTDVDNVLFDDQTTGGPFHTYWTQNFAAGDTQVVPLPAAMWIFGSGILALVAFGRRT